MRIPENIRTPKGELLYEKPEILRKAERFKNRKFFFRKWDMYWAAVRFEDDERFFKIRPVILIDQIEENCFKILCCSHSYREGRYPLKNYLNLGLKGPSFVLNKTELIEPQYILDPLRNSLSFEDRKGLLLRDFL